MSGEIAGLLFPDWFAWMVAPIVVFDALRTTRIQIRVGRRTRPAALVVSSVEGALVFGCLCARTPLVLLVMVVLHFAVKTYRHGSVWKRGAVATLCTVAAAGTLAFAAGVPAFDGSWEAMVDPTLRSAVLVLLVLACVLTLVPVHVLEESRGAQVAPVALIAFTRMALPLSSVEPRATLVVPLIAVGVALVSALWLLTAGMRANHFERASLVSELLVCERGVLFSFVWMGLASGEHLAVVGAVLEWWSGALALVALESALRVKVLPKPVAFFALAMAVGLPGTVGFVAEDLLAHGLLELRPLLAAGFVAVGAINAAALYLAFVNVVAEVGYDPRPAPPPTFAMLLPAILSVIVGLVPRPFVTSAALAHIAVGGTPPAPSGHARTVRDDGYDVPPP